MATIKLKDISTRAPKEFNKQDTKQKLVKILDELDELQNLLLALLVQLRINLQIRLFLPRNQACLPNPSAIPAFKHHECKQMKQNGNTERPGNRIRFQEIPHGRPLHQHGPSMLHPGDASKSFVPNRCNLEQLDMPAGAERDELTVADVLQFDRARS